MRRATACSIAASSVASVFQSTLSMRRATGRRVVESVRIVISIHALHEERDTWPAPLDRPQTISIHALHEESDSGRNLIAVTALFQSTLSMRRATTSKPVFELKVQFQSTLSMRRATVPQRQTLPQGRISIHALHEESDQTFIDSMTARGYISIHALHEESDSAAGHFCPLFETQASCLALSISNNTADTTNNMSKTSNWLSVSF